MKERLVSGHDDSVYEESSFRSVFILTLNQHSETLQTIATLPTPQSSVAVSLCREQPIPEFPQKILILYRLHGDMRHEEGCLFGVTVTQQSELLFDTGNG